MADFLEGCFATLLPIHGLFLCKSHAAVRSVEGMLAAVGPLRSWMESAQAAAAVETDNTAAKGPSANLLSAPHAAPVCRRYFWRR